MTPYDKYRGHTDEEIKKQIFHATTKIDSTYKKLLVSGDVKRYEVQWNGEKWIKYGTWLAAPRESRFLKNERILVQQIIDWSSLRIFVSYTNEELYNTQNQFNLLAHEGINLKFILSILASQLISFYHRKTFLDTALQRFQKVLIKDAKLLPIRKINFTTNSDHRQQGLENFINLYQQYQIDHQLDPILTQCEQHLNQQPEEADIIHDFLAYLAEQMMQLNQQKQTEIKGFLKWLERFIGCPVDTLKNKSKIQNYLGDYTKQKKLDPALDVDSLIKILNQNKKLIKIDKIDPKSRKDQEPIETEYQTSLNTLLPIKTQLKNCDNLIDEIVYQLYGLTPEEKAIIENSMK